MRQIALVMALAIAALLAGCSEPVPQTPRDLGMVSQSRAFGEAREVLSQYFSVESADADSGVILSRWRPVEPERGDRVVSSRMDSREQATMKFRNQDGRLVANLSIPVQRLITSSMRQFSPRGDTYSSVPDQTPADVDAATTPDQNDTWRTVRYNHVLERQILDELYRRLHPEAATEPAPTK